MGGERLPALAELLQLLGAGDHAAQPALHAQELLHAVLANVTDFVVVCRPDGIILYTNRFHPGVESTNGMSALDVVAAEDRPNVEAALARCVTTAQPTEYDVTAMGPHGTQHQYHVRVAPVVHGDAVVALTLIATDVTTRLATERALRERDEQLRQAQKMEAIGQLVAGLAHNFNNLLMAILPNLDRAERLALPEAQPYLARARHAAGRAGQIVADLLLYAGKTRARPRRHRDVAHVVREAVAMFRAGAGASIGIELDVATDLPPVEVDPVQIEQALLNLLLNARDALDEAAASDPLVRVSAVARSGQVEIAVTDNGCGMDATVRARVFEPFYTTKSVGRGTGLGLSTTRAIVAEHGGRVSFESQPGHGTTFFMHLPVSARAQGSVEMRAPHGGGGDGDGDGERGRQARGSGGVAGGMVLLVDDEPLVRRAVGEVLRDAGYRVMEATDGQSGLDLFLEHQRDIDLLVVDEAMPVMSGSELMTRVRHLAPELRAILITGYAGDARTASLVNAVIEKPVESDVLVAVVERVLAGR
ncbi:MAG TPA: ATP-binding protein [Kofleriaceae bacterium]|nr:ATP-binding protein [Kofleriaceae bacterium]